MTIPNVYNLILAMLWYRPQNVQVDNVKVVHYYAAGSKPWRYTEEEENMEREDIKMLEKKWWDIYEDETLDYDADMRRSKGAMHQITPRREKLITNCCLVAAAEGNGCVRCEFC